MNFGALPSIVYRRSSIVASWPADGGVPTLWAAFSNEREPRDSWLSIVKSIVITWRLHSQPKTQRKEKKRRLRKQWGISTFPHQSALSYRIILVLCIHYYCCTLVLVSHHMLYLVSYIIPWCVPYGTLRSCTFYTTRAYHTCVSRTAVGLYTVQHYVVYVLQTWEL